MYSTLRPSLSGVFSFARKPTRETRRHRHTPREKRGMHFAVGEKKGNGYEGIRRLLRGQRRAKSCRGFAPSCRFGDEEDTGRKERGKEEVPVRVKVFIEESGWFPD